MREQVKNGVPGIPVILVLLIAGAVTVTVFVRSARMLPVAPSDAGVLMVGSVLLGIHELFLAGCLFVVAPNQARVLQLFGAYAGTAKEPGLRWANPFYTKKAISQRVRSFESADYQCLAFPMELGQRTTRKSLVERCNVRLRMPAGIPSLCDGPHAF